jgi:predicted MFS family arabinose efflux permease
LPLPALVAVLVLVGAAVPPVLVTTTVLARERAPAGRLTSTFSWLASCSAAGSAASAALTGALVDGVGPAAAFALAAGAAVGVAVIGRTGR